MHSRIFECEKMEYMPKPPQINSAFIVAVIHPEPKLLGGFYRELSFSCCSDRPPTSLFLPSFGLEEFEQLNVKCSHSDG